ncbi:reverse transcriptase-like protein-like protein, partial [Lasius niger]
MMDDQEEVTPPVKIITPPKPQPFYLKTEGDWRIHLQAIYGLIEETPPVKIVGDFAMLKVSSIDKFRQVQSYLTTKNVQYYGMNPRSERPRKYIIRGLHIDTPLKVIEAELTNEGFEVIRVAQLKRMDREEGCRKSLPLFLCTIRNKTGIEEIFNLEVLLGYYIRVEVYKAKGPRQCYNCQRYGHSSECCKLPPRCLKCAESHSTSNCTKVPALLPTCANCKGQHPANARVCPFHPDNLRAKRLGNTETIGQNSKYAISTNATTNSVPPIAQLPNPQTQVATACVPAYVQRTVEPKARKTYSAALVPNTTTPIAHASPAPNLSNLQDFNSLLENIIRNLEKLQALSCSIGIPVKQLLNMPNLTASLTPNIPAETPATTSNCTSYEYKIGEFRQFLIDYSVDVALIQEVKSLNLRGLQVANYTLHHTPRNGPDNQPSAYGGTAIFIKSNIPHTILTQLENIIVKINLANTTIILCSVYNKISTGSSLPIDIHKLFSTGHSVILAGDLNAHHSLWRAAYNNRSGTEIVNYCQQNTIDISFPEGHTRFSGRHASLLDMALLKNINFAHTITSLAELSSDHNPVLLDLSTGWKLPAMQHPHSVDWTRFTTIMQQLPLEPHDISTTVQLDSAVDELTNNIQKAIEEAKCRVFKENYNILPSYIRQLIRYRNSARRDWQRSRAPTDRTEYYRLNAAVKSSIHKHRNDSWESYLKSLEPGDNSVWKHVRTIKRSSTPMPPIKSNSGTAIENDDKVSAIADSLENQFQPNGDVFNLALIDKVCNSNERYFKNTNT